MSFLADPPLLYAAGRALGAKAGELGESRAKAAAAATLGVFYGVSIPLYLNQRWVAPFVWPLPAKTGRDWMINSGVLRLEHERPGTLAHALSAAIFATYPLALAAGFRAGRG